MYYGQFRYTLYALQLYIRRLQRDNLCNYISAVHNIRTYNEIVHSMC